MNPSDPLVVAPAGPLRGTVIVPGDKSVSHRAVLLAAMAHGTTTIRGALESEDVAATLAAVRALGAVVETDGGGALRVTGGDWCDATVPLDCGNAGTAARLLMGSLASRASATLVGDASLTRRPMARVLRPLRAMGARVEGGPTLPVRVERAALHGMEWESEVASAQVKSAVLLAALSAEGSTTYVERQPTRDHTERLLRAMGAAVDSEPDGSATRIRVRPSRLHPVEVDVPRDLSSAMPWVVAAALVPGSDLTLPDVGLNAGRVGALEVLRRMGAALDVCAADEVAHDEEPRGTVRVRCGGLRGTRVDAADVPALVDELPLLAVAAGFAEGETVISGAAELRVKESDRIRATVAGLRALGFDADERPDGMVVAGGGPRTRPRAPVASQGDHRIAMAFAIAGLRVGAVVCDTACVSTSYPGFANTLLELSRG